MKKIAQVLIVGGGHAGCEAAYAAARMGCQTLLLCLEPSKIAFMSCNPAIGGLAKGQLVKEIDALGGLMGMNTDKAAIQYRRLNASKGPAVQSSRAQCDKMLYAQQMQAFLKTVPGLEILKGEVVDLIVVSGKIQGVRLQDGREFLAKAVVITSGTFLKGLMHMGETQISGGRFGDRAAFGLSESLTQLGFQLKRLKTGTPPRLHRTSIDFSKTEVQSGDEKPLPFSFYHRPDPFPWLSQVDCYITYTCLEAHEIIEKNLHLSPLFNGQIQSIGPRYCPSIEDKVFRFKDKTRHQIFLEPECLNTDEIYVNGISTSLPSSVQEEFVRKIPGLENAKFIRYGYAVEYDCIDACQLKSTYESKDISGLFFAGQINGTSGYEEAAAQGIIAGINAALLVQEKEPYVFSRFQGYLGVLTDDLILKGIDEPYRMFTSRAEYRLLLREDNADLRLSEVGWKIGLLSELHYQKFQEKREAIEKWKTNAYNYSIYPNASVNQFLSKKGLRALKDKITGNEFLRRPEIRWKDLCEIGFPGNEVSEEVWKQVEIQTKYEGYIQRDLVLLEKMKESEMLKIPLHLDFEVISGLSREIQGRLKKVRPETIGQMMRMKGITPAAVTNVLIYLKMQGFSCAES